MSQDIHERPEFRYLRVGLSGKLLALMVMFVMTAVVLTYVPTIAVFRINWLNNRLAAAHTAALVMEVESERSVPESLRRQILDSIGAKSVVTKNDQSRHVLAVSEKPNMRHQYIDLRNISAFSALGDAFETMFLRSDQDLIRVIGPGPMGGDSLEIVLEEGLLRHAMFEFSMYVMMASMLMSAIIGVLASFAFKLHH